MKGLSFGSRALYDARDFASLVWFLFPLNSPLIFPTEVTVP